MGYNKDYVLAVARILLLEPLTAEYRTYNEALERMTYCEACWCDLTRQGAFPERTEIARRLEAYTPETQLVSDPEDGATLHVSFVLEWRRAARRSVFAALVPDQMKNTGQRSRRL